MPYQKDGTYQEDGLLTLPTLHFSTNTPENEKQAIADYLNTYLTQLGRINLIQAAQKGIDLNAAMSAHKIIAGVNTATRKEYSRKQMSKSAYGDTSPMILSFALAKEAMQNGGARYTGIAKEVTESITQLNKKFPDLVKAANKPKSRYHVNKLAEKEYANFQKAMNKAISVNMGYKNSQLKKIAEHPKYFREALRAQVVLKNTPDAKRLANIMNNGRFLGMGLFTLGITLGVADVYKDYEDGKDWGKSAAGLSGQTLGAIAGGAFGGMIFEFGLVALSITPAGWVVLIGGAITAGAMAYVGSEVGKNFSEGSYEWAQNHIRKIN